MIKPLLKNERNILFNTIRTLPTQNLLGFGVIAVIFIGVLYFVSRAVWRFCPALTAEILSSILTYVFLLILGFVILIGTAQVFKGLYTATDLQLLFTMPIKTRHISWLKYIKTFIYVPLFMIFLFAIPLVVYGIASGVSMLYYPVVFIVLIAVSLIGLSFAFLLNLILVQIIPAHRANEFFTVMSFLSGILTYFLIMSPSMRSDGDLLESIVGGVPIFPKWIPLTWGSEAVVHAASQSLHFLLPLIILIIFAFILIILATTLTERGFRKSWIRMNEGTQRKKRQPKKKQAIYKVRHPIIAIGKKEWYILKRDMREWLSLMPLAFFFIFGIIGAFTGADIKLSTLRTYSDISWPIGQAVFMFLFSLVNGTLAAASIGREGPNDWILRVLPARGIHIAYGKLWISWLIPLVIITVIEIGVSLLLAWPLFKLVSGIVMKGFMTLGLSALGLWLGTIGAKYHPTNPQARLTFFAIVLLFISSYIYLLITAVPAIFIFVTPELVEVGGNEEITGVISFIMHSVTKLILLKGEMPIIVISLCVLAIVMISLSVMYIFMTLSARKIDRGITIDIVAASRKKPLFSTNNRL